MPARALFRLAKSLAFGTTERPFRVRSGAFRGFEMTLDPNHQTQYILGLHEREVHRWLAPLAAGARTAIDIGAASGEYTLYFLKKTAVGTVLTFDPDDVSRRQFDANLALNGLANDPRLVPSAKFVRSGESTDSVTLDSLARTHPLPFAIKIDVDGGETDILRGAGELLKTGQARWLIETHSVELEAECRAILTAAGYRVTIVPNAWWRAIVPEQRPIPHNRWLVAFPDGPPA